MQIERSERQEGVSSRRKNHKITGCARRDSGHFNLGKKCTPVTDAAISILSSFFSLFTLFQVSKKTFFQMKVYFERFFKMTGFRGLAIRPRGLHAFYKGLAPCAFLAGSSRLLKSSPTYTHIFFLLKTLIANTCSSLVATGDTTAVGHIANFAESNFSFLRVKGKRKKLHTHPEENQAANYH